MAKVMAVFLLALIFAFLNGFHDSANIVALAISSKAIRPGRALALAALAEFVAPFAFGVAVATTIGHDLVEPKSMRVEALAVALASAIVWSLITWYKGIPSSSSHALLGGIIGVAVASGGLSIVKPYGLYKVVLSLFLSPLLGFIGGFFLMKITLWLARGASPRVNLLFKRAQIAATVMLALSHGSNDAQKSIGVMAMALAGMRGGEDFFIPSWIKLLCAAAIAAGVGAGGWRIMRTIGGKFYKIRPIHGFSAQLSSVGVILGAVLTGGPVSTSQVVSSAIVGVGSAERLSKVRWKVFREIALSWLVTFPLTALIAWGLSLLLRLGT
jgi:PiT family inorganic phosphate transporter